ncbi:hypothetical protein [Pediococcus pentosaceus]|jgi:uncharacterized protein YlzI (FlbEa/FlbD family)|uniref:hypothetical protein n=1 Tax=Pediococcus pentosaceus TaxID=1255 RepID=UPI002E335E83|nr:hypothetical protein [Pediococcus pentosaceus]
MKLVKIKEDLYLNSDFIESVEADGEGSTIITMTSGEVFSPNVSIKKVLDAICGSEEHLNGKDNLIKAVVDGLSGITDITKISVEYNRRNHEQPGGFQVHRR